MKLSNQIAAFLAGFGVLISGIALASADTVQTLLVVEISYQEAAPEDGLTDDQIRDILILESIAGYAGNCPCPYNRTSNGRRCGKRSAYSRPGGASPLCYAHDVTDRMIENYRRRHSSN